MVILWELQRRLYPRHPWTRPILRPSERLRGNERDGGTLAALALYESTASPKARPPAQPRSSLQRPKHRTVVLRICGSAGLYGCCGDQEVVSTGLNSLPWISVSPIKTFANGDLNRFENRRSHDIGPPTNPSPTANRIHQWISHACMNTTIEIASSTTLIPSSPYAQGTFDIPRGFFFNSEALGLVLDGVGNLVCCALLYLLGAYRVADRYRPVV